MESSPLNQAHVLRRSAERFLRAHQIEEALSSHTQAAHLLQRALASTTCPKARESVQLQLQVQDLESQFIRLQSSVVRQRLAQMRSAATPAHAETKPAAMEQLAPFKNSVLNTLGNSQALLNTLSEASEVEMVHAAVSRLQSQHSQLESSFRELFRLLEGLQADNQQLRLQLASLPSQITPPQEELATPLLVSSAITTLERSSSSETAETDPDIPALPPLECPHFDFSVFDTLKLE